METPHSTTDRPSKGRRRAIALAATAGLLSLTLGTTTSAAAPQVADPDGSSKVEKLTKEIKSLEKSYGGNLEQLRDARLDAKNALEKVRDLRADLNRARALVAEMAASQYMNNGMDPSVQVLGEEDPSNLLDSATLASHVTQNQAARVKQIQSLVTRQDQARTEAQTKIKKLEGDIKETSQRKEQVKKLLKKYKPESPMVGNGGMTSRMVKVRDEIEAELGPFITIGCTRPGDPQDHGSGRACDFMESSAGNMPSAARMAHGDQVAAYAIKHADRLGIKYVIWRQRIYDMRSPGWKTMSNRGSITQNHMDHNHISVF
ncbi:coiled-coil domain-containing protein [Actinomadura sp. 6N118]|uniref:coiled-coil domain-containing protein n=1 Tax=Actinomadura sp. 6N118 TaxID=3375151 RepID=UPI003794C4BA